MAGAPWPVPNFSSSKKMFWRVEDEGRGHHLCPELHPISLHNCSGRMPSSFSPSFYSTKPRPLLQFDYIGIRPSYIGAKYVPMHCKDHRRYCWLFNWPDKGAENAAMGIKDWSPAFRAPAALLSDCPMQLCKETIGLVSKGLCMLHHFLLQYFMWPNYAIERLGKQLLHILSAITAERHIFFKELSNILSLIQSAISNAPSPQQCNMATIAAVHGTEPTPPFKTIYITGTNRPVTINTVEHNYALKVAAIVKSMKDMHLVIHENVVWNHQQATKSKSWGSLPNFDVADYVCVAWLDLFA